VSDAPAPPPRSRINGNNAQLPASTVLNYATTRSPHRMVSPVQLPNLAAAQPTPPPRTTSPRGNPTPALSPKPGGSIFVLSFFFFFCIPVVLRQ
jgi:hypothetical protein